MLFLSVLGRPLWVKVRALSWSSIIALLSFLIISVDYSDLGVMCITVLLHFIDHILLIAVGSMTYRNTLHDTFFCWLQWAPEMSPAGWGCIVKCLENWIPASDMCSACRQMSWATRWCHLNRRRPGDESSRSLRCFTVFASCDIFAAC